MTVANGITDGGIARIDIAPAAVNYQALSRKIVDGLDLGPLTDHPGKDPAVRSDLLAVVACCMESVVAAARTGAPVPERAAARMAGIAARWAERQLPIAMLQHAVHAGAEAVVEPVVAAGRRTVAGLPAAGLVLIESLRTLSTAIARGYTGEVRAMTRADRVESHTLVSALLAGRADSVMVRRNGIELAATYLVVAVALGPHPDEHDPRLDAGVVARRKLRRVQAELACEGGARVLSMLSVDGGTLLIPVRAAGDEADAALDDLIDRIGRAAAAPMTAAVVSAARDDVPRAAERAHELLDLALRLGRGTGLHRFRELACEYQLVQPGPGNRQLRALLDPLRDEPELLDTVEAYFAAQCKRESAARRLGISVGALRRRLDRIATLTGLRPDAPADQWYLRASYIARIVDPRSPDPAL
ncbi:PucR family transcriptional regulator [Nocardia wallacei]|uniref:PucR family transcriptional regulator n=1 Tax=Nocardia wallacei TaxID=480035 RepID=UPI002456A251|nr:helix-turn-helix domain-containing protein [Nocardia wallacei]